MTEPADRREFTGSRFPSLADAEFCAVGDWVKDVGFIASESVREIVVICARKMARTRRDLRNLADALGKENRHVHKIIR